jgi:hypothetical protein
MHIHPTRLHFEFEHSLHSNLFTGVLTKLDIMDRGTNALGMLHNDVLPLRLGYIAVVNRSQYDIQEKTPVSKARENEAKFFSEHPEYASVAAQCGIPALSKRCARLPQHHVSFCNATELTCCSLPKHSLFHHSLCG